MIDTATIASAIEQTPPLVRLALTSRDPRQRERAAMTIAQVVEDWLTERPSFCADQNQMTLPLA